MSAFPRTVKTTAAFASASKRKFHRLTPEDLVRAKELLGKGLSYRVAARKLGCTDGALRNRFPGYNRPKRQW